MAKKKEETPAKENTWTLTEEHKKQIPAHNEKWIEIIKSTKPMDAEDRRVTREAIQKLYEHAEIKEKPNVVFTSSPMQAAVIASSASWIRFVQKQYPTHVKGARKIDPKDPSLTPLQKAIFEALGDLPPTT